MKYFLVAIIIGIAGCSKKGGSPAVPIAPMVTTTLATAITTTTAQSGGTVTADGGAQVTARGICWNLTGSPTITHDRTSDGTGPGSFTSTMSGLLANTTYYVRAYATNSVGTSYGNSITVKTTQGLPTVTTNDVVFHDGGTYALGGTLVSDGGLSITDQGVCWGTAQNPTLADTKASQMPATIFTIMVPHLQAKTTYYIRAFATNGAGTSYGNQVTLTPPIAIGLTYAGGIIFDIDGSGVHGLVAAPADQGTTIPWALGNLYTTTTGATSTTDGAANTTKIISVYGNSGSYAAKLCRDYRGGGYTDWFLPSGGQLNTLVLKQSAVGGFPGSEFLTNYNYWSSTENNNFRAWEYNFNPRYYFVDAEQKNVLNYVRAVRAF